MFLNRNNMLQNVCTREISFEIIFEITIYLNMCWFLETDSFYHKMPEIGLCIHSWLVNNYMEINLTVVIVIFAKLIYECLSYLSSCRRWWWWWWRWNFQEILLPIGTATLSLSSLLFRTHFHLRFMWDYIYISICIVYIK